MTGLQDELVSLGVSTHQMACEIHEHADRRCLRYTMRWPATLQRGGAKLADRQRIHSAVSRPHARSSAHPLCCTAPTRPGAVDLGESTASRRCEGRTTHRLRRHRPSYGMK